MTVSQQKNNNIKFDKLNENQTKQKSNCCLSNCCIKNCIKLTSK